MNKILTIISLLLITVFVGCSNGSPIIYANNTAIYNTSDTDLQVFQKALDMLPNSGGTLNILPGTYHFNSFATRNIPNVIVTGDSPNGVTFISDNSTVFKVGGNGWIFRNINIQVSDGGDGINMDNARYGLWENVTINGKTYDYKSF